MLLDNLQAAAIEQPVSYYFTSFYHCFYSFHGSNSLCKWIYERFLQDIITMKCEPFHWKFQKFQEENQIEF